MNQENFIRALRLAGLSPDEDSLADFFFLASRMSFAAQPVAAPDGAPDAAPIVPATGAVTTTGQLPRHVPAVSVPEEQAAPKAGLFAPDPNEGTIPAAEIEVPEAPVLPQALEISRSLRPLLKRFHIPGIGPLDEDASADQSAHLRRLVLVFRPAIERWFDLALVVEDSPSMAVWTKTVEAFERVVERVGAFRDVRRWRLQPDGGITDSTGKPTSPAALLAADGRRMVMVLTQGVSATWRSDRWGEAILRWGRTQPTAVIQLLPEPLWENTVLGEPTLVARSAKPGVPNSAWDVEFPSWMRRRVSGGIALPVIRLDSSSLGNWAAMLMSKGDAGVPAVFWSALRSRDARQVADEVGEISSEDRVEGFRRNSSAEAFRLATALSAGPITLPILRLVNQTLFSEHARQETLAEILLGGLLNKARDHVDPEQIYFEFHPGVRELVAHWSRSEDRLAVRRQVTRYLQEHPDAAQRFRVLVPHKEGKYLLPSWAEPFAEESEDLLRACGLQVDETVSPPVPEPPPVGPAEPTLITRRVAVIVATRDTNFAIKLLRRANWRIEEAKRFVRALESRGFETHALYDSKATLTNATLVLAQVLGDADEGTFLWFHFSGDARIDEDGRARLLFAKDAGGGNEIGLERVFASMRGPAVRPFFTSDSFETFPGELLRHPGWAEGVSCIVAHAPSSLITGQVRPGLVASMTETIGAMGSSEGITLETFDNETNNRIQKGRFQFGSHSIARIIRENLVLFAPVGAPATEPIEQGEEENAANRLDAAEDTESVPDFPAPELADFHGRTEELGTLERAWNNPEIHAVQILGPAGSGKTALMELWARTHDRTPIFRWSFHGSSTEGFFSALARFVGFHWEPQGRDWSRYDMLYRTLLSRQTIVLLDGLDLLDYNEASPLEGNFGDFLRRASRKMNGLLVVASRVRHKSIPDSALTIELDSPEQAPHSAMVELSALAAPWNASESRTLNDLVVDVLRLAVKITEAERGYYFTATPGSDSPFQFELGVDNAGKVLRDPPSISIAVIVHAAARPEAFVRLDPYDVDDSEPSHRLGRSTPRRAIGMPLRDVSETESRTLEVIYLVSPIVSSDFPSNRNQIARFAAEAGRALGQAWRKEVEESAASISRELNEAHKIQEELLNVHLPTIDFARVAVRYETAREIGGDFYDVVFNQGSLYVVMGDVSGKGLPAVHRAKDARDRVREGFQKDEPLNLIAEHLNRFWPGKEESYATMLFVRLTSEGAFEIVNCGHVEALLLSSGAITPYSSTGVPVGLFKSITYSTVNSKLVPGDRLLLVTDGIIDADNEAQEFYSDSRLTDAFQRSKNLDHILADWRQFRGSAPVSDDWTAIEISFRGKRLEQHTPAATAVPKSESPSHSMEEASTTKEQSQPIPDVEAFLRLAKDYEKIRSSRPASGTRTAEMTRLFSKGLDLASWLETKSVSQVISALEKQEPGRRLMCIAIATTHVDSANIHWLLEFLDHFRSPFEHYCCIRATSLHVAIMSKAQKQTVAQILQRQWKKISADSGRVTFAEELLKQVLAESNDATGLASRKDSSGPRRVPKVPRSRRERGTPG